jgi:hypothetical protein
VFVKLHARVPVLYPRTLRRTVWFLLCVEGSPREPELPVALDVDRGAGLGVVRRADRELGLGEALRSRDFIQHVLALELALVEPIVQGERVH